MNVVIVIVGLVLLVGGICLAIFKHVDEGQCPWWSKLAIVLGLVLSLIGASFQIIPTGYSGVKTTFGQISSEVLPRGFNFKIPFVQSIRTVNNKQQDKLIETQIWGETIEKTPVYASETIVTYQIMPDAAAWIFSNVSNPDEVITESLVASAEKSAMVELSANEVTNRSKIEPLTKEKLASSIAEKYGEGKITIVKVVINQMDFEEAYNQAIAEKSIAQQKQEKQEIENKTAVAKAEADKKVTITNAEAKAESTRISAEAEANANKLLQESLTDPILKSKFYEKWDGKLPQVMGEKATIANIAAEAN